MCEALLKALLREGEASAYAAREANTDAEAVTAALEMFRRAGGPALAALLEEYAYAPRLPSLLRSRTDEALLLAGVIHRLARRLHKLRARSANVRVRVLPHANVFNWQP